MATIALPGLIDPHVHLRDPGQTHKEDFYTATAAAVAGGYTKLLDMPNNHFPIVSRQRLMEKIETAREKIVCDVGFYFGSLGSNFDEFEKVQNSVFGLKLYLNETTGSLTLKYFTVYAQKANPTLSEIFNHWGGLVLVHAEDKTVEEVLSEVRRTQKPTHFCHVTKTELEQLIKAKEQGLPITCGVTPHHLFLTEDDEKHLGPFAKVKPRLKSKKDTEYLWKHLSYIDVVESDHAPHTIDEKRSPDSPFGVPGVETTLPLLLTAASQGRISIEQIINLCFHNPAKIFGIKTDASTRVEVDTGAPYEIKNESLFTKCKWSPFNGWRVKGKVQTVYIRGTKVFENQHILVNQGFGTVLSP